MVYSLYACYGYDEFDLTDNDGRVLYFPSEETAVSFAEKYKSNFLHDEYTDYEIDVDFENRTYAEEEAKILIEFLLDM